MNLKADLAIPNDKDLFVSINLQLYLFYKDGTVEFLDEFGTWKPSIFSCYGHRGIAIRQFMFSCTMHKFPAPKVLEYA